MGRGVSIPNNACAVVIKNICWIGQVVDEDGNETDEYCEFQEEYDWEFFIEDFRNVLSEKGLTEADEWIGNEDHVLAENDYFKAGISEYCGTAALWLVEKSINRGFSCCGDTWEEEGDEEGQSYCNQCGEYIDPDPITDLRVLAQLKGTPAWFEEIFKDKQEAAA